MTRDKCEVGDFSLLISLFVRLLANYLLVMVDIPKIVAFKVVIYTMMQLWV